MIPALLAAVVIGTAPIAPPRINAAVDTDRCATSFTIQAPARTWIEFTGDIGNQPPAYTERIVLTVRGPGTHTAGARIHTLDGDSATSTATATNTCRPVPVVLIPEARINNPVPVRTPAPVAVRVLSPKWGKS